MQLSPHFTLDEFTASDTATRMGIDNGLPVELYINATKTMEMMEVIRSHLSSVSGKPIPIQITSGYRCAALNRAIGSTGGDHPQARAVDFKAPAFGSAFEVAKSLSTQVEILGIGQLIYEFGSWVHVSTRIPDKIINRILTINHLGTRAGIKGA